MKKLLLTTAAAVALLTGCSSYTGTDNMETSKSATFALIPFVLRIFALCYQVVLIFPPNQSLGLNVKVTHLKRGFHFQVRFLNFQVPIHRFLAVLFAFQ